MIFRTATIACALALLSTVAMAQTIKAKGSSAAGVCAGALDMLGGFASESGRYQQEQIEGIARVRDFFMNLPQFPAAEVDANAKAFVRLMSDRYRASADSRVHEGITKEIVQISSGCLATARQQMRNAPQALPQIAPSAPAIVTPQIQPAPTVPVTPGVTGEPLYIPQGSLD